MRRSLCYAVVDNGKTLQPVGMTAVHHRKSGSHTESANQRLILPTIFELVRIEVQDMMESLR